MKNSIITASILAAGLAFSGAVNAAPATATLNIAATFLPACAVTTAAVNFGSLPAGSLANANGDVSVNCSAGVPYHIALDAGSHPAALGGLGLVVRNVANGTAGFAPYFLYKDLVAFNEWGDSDYANTHPGTSFVDIGSGVIQPHTVFGLLSSYTIVAAPGTYTDIVNVSVYY